MLKSKIINMKSREKLNIWIEENINKIDTEKIRKILGEPIFPNWDNDNRKKEKIKYLADNCLPSTIGLGGCFEQKRKLREIIGNEELKKITFMQQTCIKCEYMTLLNFKKNELKEIIKKVKSEKA